MSEPIVFVSYSYDSESHIEWVVRLASDLRRNGVDAKIDKWDLALGQDVAVFMTRSITDAERVLLICSEKYVQKAEQGAGGVAFELSVVTNQLVQSIDTR